MISKSDGDFEVQLVTDDDNEAARWANSTSLASDKPNDKPTDGRQRMFFFVRSMERSGWCAGVMRLKGSMVRLMEP